MVTKNPEVHCQAPAESCATSAGPNSVVRLNGNSHSGDAEDPRFPPSLQASAELQYAFGYFNDALWGGRVPQPILTYTRKANCRGYFAPDRFQSVDGLVVSEVALNAAYLAVRTDRESMGTLVHEGAHAWRHYLGPLNSKGGRGSGGYHDTVWAKEMLRIGLIPSSTGAPGGKPTGYRVSHYIEEGGLFDRTCAALLETDFRISWSDRIVRPNAVDGEGSSGGATVEIDKTAKRDRIKFTCSEKQCGLNAWAKPSALLICGSCRVPMHPVETLARRVP